MTNTDYCKALLLLLDGNHQIELDINHHMTMTKAGTIYVTNRVTGDRKTLRECSSDVLEYLNFVTDKYKEYELSGELNEVMHRAIKVWLTENKPFMVNDNSAIAIEIVYSYIHSSVLCKVNSCFNFIYKSNTGYIVCEDEVHDIVLRLLWRGLSSMSKQEYLSHVNKMIHVIRGGK